MKDYYYILGVSKQAELSEIQLAFKKLSLKFHPNKNDNDPFFVLHYNKIKEAHDILSDDHKRFRYDKALGEELSAEVGRILDGPAPVVASFFASKKASKKGDLLTISWEVLNAESVHIDLIGDVASNGTQTIRLMEELDAEEYIYIELIAKNRTSTQSSSKMLQIKNLAYSPRKASQRQKRSNVLSDELTQEEEKATNSKKKTPKPNKKTKKSVEKDDDYSHIKRQQGTLTAYILVFMMFALIIMMLYTLHSINPMF